ncbi:MAG: hypothetical protein AAGL23_08365 [Pseudomonadota bacterium]
MTPLSFDPSPFGEPNASDRSDIENTYVDVTDVLSAKYITTNDITKAKIVVGRKGSGKTHLLRHIEILSRPKAQVCKYLSLGSDIFSGRGIRAFRGAMSPEETTVFWAELWKAAFLLSALTIFYNQNPEKRAIRAIRACEGDVFHKETPDHIEDFRASVRKNYPQISWDPVPRRPLSPISMLSEITKRYTNLNSINEDFRKSLNFDELEYDVLQLLHQYGQVHYIIDGLDELAWADLTGWLDVQRGLFKCAFLLSAVSKSTQYLKVTISIRNYVFNRSTQDPHADRTDAHLLKLNWDRDAAESFLNQRLHSALGGNFARSEVLEGPRPFAKWLGFETKLPSSRKIEESVEQYLLRHTRLSPRNIIDALNKLASVIGQAQRRQDVFGSDEFSEAISEIARDIAKKMLVTTAEEVVATIPGAEKVLAARQDDYRVQGEFLINMVADELEAAIAMMETEVVSREKFRQLLELIADFSIGSVSDKSKRQICRDIEGILWRSGLIAYRDGTDGPWKYSWADGEFGFSRPAVAAEEIGFHSSLIDLCGLKVTEDAPIF